MQTSRKDIQKWNRLVLFILLFIFAFHHGEAQTRQELEKKRKEKEKEIEYTKKLISETTEQQKKTVNYLNILNHQINVRESLIATIQKELKFLNEQIDAGSREVMGLEANLRSLKKEYSNMVVFAYKNRNTYNRLGFILSANTFNQSFKRLKLLQNYSAYRKKQMTLIRETAHALSLRLKELSAQKEEKTRLLASQTKEKDDLEKDKVEKSKLVKHLQGQEKELRKQLKEQMRIAAALNKAIQEIIRKEIEKANTTKTTTGKKESYGMTPEAKLLSTEFTANMTKLPWPVEKGFISEPFGEREHPSIKGFIIVNNGIDIQTEKNMDARAVFNGVVAEHGIISIPGANKAVLIKHGDFFTVYSNLDEVYVQNGQKVTTKQAIGRIHTNTKTGITELHFEIWKQQTKMNPESWLYRK